MAWSLGDLMLDPGNPKMRKSCNDVTKRCKPKYGDAENHWSWERMRQISPSTCPHFWRQFLHCRFQPCKLCSPPSVQSISVNFSMLKQISMSFNWLNHLHHHFCLFHGCPRHFHLPFHPPMLIALFSLWPASACSSEIWMMAILSRAATSDNKQVWDFGHGQIDSSVNIDQKIWTIISEQVSDVVYFVNATHFCIALLSNVVLVVVCVVAVVCKSRLKMAIASLLQD